VNWAPRGKRKIPCRAEKEIQIVSRTVPTEIAAFTVPPEVAFRLLCLWKRAFTPGKISESPACLGALPCRKNLLHAEKCK